jgi:cholesterol oxidase
MSVEHVYAVVVGSGFGGSVATYRIAEAGRPVVLLERGKAYAPGDFARTPAQMSRNFWDPSAGLHGLFDVWSFRGLEALVSSGLGGGSLIYANVLLRKDERWFVQHSPVPGGGYEHWPVGRADLDPHYDVVERMLGATPYPYADRTPKTLALKQSAQLRRAAGATDVDWQLPPLGITFAGAPGQSPVPGAPIPLPLYGNLHGVPRSSCRLCGECDLGCNDGAKNTLDHTYLSAAKHHGADIRTRCEVRGFSPRSEGGFEVRYVRHEPENEGRKVATSRLPSHTITCDRLILGAGTLGTTYLLLRNRAALPRLSPMLGRRFCGNGDLLTFVTDARDPTSQAPRRIEGSRGPVITSAIRVGDAIDGTGSTGRGFYVQDAGYPALAEWFVEAARGPASLRRAARFAWDRLRGRLGRSSRSEISAAVSALIGSGSFSDGSLPLLGMGRDVPDGVMRLRRGHLAIDWTTATSLDYFARVRNTMREIAGDLGADFHDSPLWWTKRVVTVHPLGGAPMGRSPAEGVCDGYGEVYGFPGLYVLDGALLPGPVGANPSLTIAAMADRACDRLLASAAPSAASSATPSATLSTPPPVVRNGHAEPAPAAVAPVRSGGAAASSLSFTEEMKGFVAVDVDDPVEGARLGRERGQRLAFRVTIATADVERFCRDADHEAEATGHVDCDLLGGRLSIDRGWFNLFVRDGDGGHRRMLYRFHLTTDGGNRLTLVGHKDIRDDPGLDVWPDTSTLYLRILGGHTLADDDPAASTIASGIVTIHLPDFLQQLTTFRVGGPQPVSAARAFGQLFLGELWRTYGPALERSGRAT